MIYLITLILMSQALVAHAATPQIPTPTSPQLPMQQQQQVLENALPVAGGLQQPQQNDSNMYVGQESQPTQPYGSNRSPSDGAPNSLGLDGQGNGQQFNQPGPQQPLTSFPMQQQTQQPTRLNGNLVEGPTATHQHNNSSFVNNITGVINTGNSGKIDLKDWRGQNLLITNDCKISNSTVAGTLEFQGKDMSISDSKVSILSVKPTSHQQTPQIILSGKVNISNINVDPSIYVHLYVDGSTVCLPVTLPQNVELMGEPEKEEPCPIKKKVGKKKKLAGCKSTCSG